MKHIVLALSLLISGTAFADGLQNGRLYCNVFASSDDFKDENPFVSRLRITDKGNGKALFQFLEDRSVFSSSTPVAGSATMTVDAKNPNIYRNKRLTAEIYQTKQGDIEVNITTANGKKDYLYAIGCM